MFHGRCRTLCLLGVVALSLLPSCAGTLGGVRDELSGARCASFPFDPSCDGIQRTVQGRTYCLHVPASTQGATRRLPVVMMLHAYVSDGQGESSAIALDDLSDELGFLLVKPNGTNDSLGLHFWNASSACCAMHASAPPDDVAFLMAVLDDVESAYDVDRHREYVIGHSNGALMAQRLACEHAERFAAAASISGAADVECTPRAPISMLEIHGDADSLISFEGGTVAGASTPYASVDETLAYWIAADHCEAARPQIEITELVCDGNENETTITRYGDCAAGTTVELWQMHGVGHLPWLRTPIGAERVLRFLFAHRR